MVRCRPFYLPREFSSVIITAVYIPLQANTTLAFNELCVAIDRQESTHLEAALLVGGGFNAGRLKTILPHFYQHVSCANRGIKSPEHFYSSHRNAYKALPRLPFGKSDYDHSPAIYLQTGSTSDAVNTEVVG